MNVIHFLLLSLFNEMKCIKVLKSDHAKGTHLIDRQGYAKLKNPKLITTDALTFCLRFKSEYLNAFLLFIGEVPPAESKLSGKSWIVYNHTLWLYTHIWWGAGYPRFTPIFAPDPQKPTDQFSTWKTDV